MKRRTLLEALCALTYSPLAKAQTDTKKEAFRIETLRIIALVKNLQPSMKRAVLERDWIRDGGLQPYAKNRYVLESHRTVKIDVEFNLVDQSGSSNHPDDIIIKVSVPYLELQYMD